MCWGGAWRWISFVRIPLEDTKIRSLHGFIVTMEARWRYLIMSFFLYQLTVTLRSFHTMYVMALLGGYERTTVLGKVKKRRECFLLESEGEEKKKKVR